MGPGREGPGRLLRSSGFALGLLAAFAVTFLDHLSWYVPSLPTVPLYYEAIAAEKTGPTGGRLGQINIILWPTFTAIAYLIPNDISLSCWVFWFVRVGLTMVAIATGGAPRAAEPWSGSDFPASTYQGAGALLALGVWSVLLARPHLTGDRCALPGAPAGPGCGRRNAVPLGRAAVRRLASATCCSSSARPGRDSASPYSSSG